MIVLMKKTAAPVLLLFPFTSFSLWNWGLKWEHTHIFQSALQGKPLDPFPWGRPMSLLGTSQELPSPLPYGEQAPALFFPGIFFPVLSMGFSSLGQALGPTSPGVFSLPYDLSHWKSYFLKCNLHLLQLGHCSLLHHCMNTQNMFSLLFSAEFNTKSVYP